LVTAEDAEKSPVGRAHEGPSPLEEPKFVFFFNMKNSNNPLFFLVDQKLHFYGLHRHGKHFDMFYGEISNGILLLVLLSLFLLFFFFLRFGHYQVQLCHKYPLKFLVDNKHQFFFLILFL
jgi:hypothetical protein